VKRLTLRLFRVAEFANKHLRLAAPEWRGATRGA
jgi:hypothetical protein